MMSDYKGPIWERVSNTYDLRAADRGELDTDHVEILLRNVEKANPEFQMRFSNDASTYFRRWLAHPNRPLKEGAYCLLSNWFLTEGPARQSSRAGHARALWSALFCCAPQERLTDRHVSDRKVIPDVFDRWWSGLLAAQSSATNTDTGGDKPREKKRTYEGSDEAPNDNLDESQRFAIRVRRGQLKFRQNLLRMYGGRCAVTGTECEAVLEATHIWPHAESGINESGNGLLLRADIHILFDEGLLRIDPDNLQVAVDPSLAETEYEALNGQPLRRTQDGSRPSHVYLLKRWIQSRGGGETK